MECRTRYWIEYWMKCQTKCWKKKRDAIFPCNTKKCESDPWKHKNVMNYTQYRRQTRIIHTWHGSYCFGTKFFKNLLQNMKKTYVHSTKVSNNCHKTDHIPGPILPPHLRFCRSHCKKKKLPLVTRLVEEDQLWKLLVLVVKTLPYASCVASVVL
jgi:hypothetical protein